jgi:hypothetical protein
MSRKIPQIRHWRRLIMAVEGTKELSESNAEAIRLIVKGL